MKPLFSLLFVFLLIAPLAQSEDFQIRCSDQQTRQTLRILSNSDGPSSPAEVFFVEDAQPAHGNSTFASHGILSTLPWSTRTFVRTDYDLSLDNGSSIHLSDVIYSVKPKDRGFQGTWTQGGSRTALSCQWEDSFSEMSQDDYNNFCCHHPCRIEVDCGQNPN